MGLSWMSCGHSRRRTGANDSFAPRREKPGRGGLRKNRTTTNRRTVAKVLRRRMTDTEQHLWTHLRAHRLARGKFKRQQPIGPYIVDFVCFHARLVIEVDGGQHLNSVDDRTRDAWLKEQGFRVLRFWDNEVLTNLPSVLEKITSYISPSPPPLSHKGRGV